MTPLLDANAAMKEAAEAYNQVRLMMGREEYKRFSEWIEALIVQNQIQMVDCAESKLPHIQIRLKQLKALRSSLVDPGGATTGYVFD